MERRSGRKKPAQVYNRAKVLVLIVLMAVLLIVAYLVYNSMSPVTAPDGIEKSVLIIIDAGHGGDDPGAIGLVSGRYECDYNLEIALELRDELQRRGHTVKLTRADANALGATKSEDMTNRVKAINESGCEIMVSIHMNSFQTDTSVKGPEVHYQQNSATGKALASAIQKPMNRTTEGKRSVKSNDLYVLRDAPMAAVLVECGYLTNAYEEEMLAKQEYQKDIAIAIADGIEYYINQ